MKNAILWIVIVLLVVLGGAWLMSRKSPKTTTAPTTTLVTPTPTPTAKPQVQAPVAGTVFADSAIVPYAHQVYPGKLSDDAKVATKGWTIKATPQKGGTTLVEFIPISQEDQKKSYTVNKGEVLYFVEMNPGDDTEAKDMYLLDDYGVIVGADGVVK